MTVQYKCVCTYKEIEVTSYNINLELYSQIISWWRYDMYLHFFQYSYDNILNKPQKHGAQQNHLVPLLSPCHPEVITK